MPKGSTNGSRAARCTILIDKKVYKKSKMEAFDQEIKFYEYVNNVLARAVGMEPPLKIKHPTTKKHKQKTQNRKVDNETLIAAPAIPGTTVAQGKV